MATEVNCCALPFQRTSARNFYWPPEPLPKLRDHWFFFFLGGRGFLWDSIIFILMIFFGSEICSIFVIVSWDLMGCLPLKVQIPKMSRNLLRCDGIIIIRTNFCGIRCRIPRPGPQIQYVPMGTWSVNGDFEVQWPFFWDMELMEACEDGMWWVVLV